MTITTHAGQPTATQNLWVAHEALTVASNALTAKCRPGEGPTAAQGRAASDALNHVSEALAALYRAGVR